MNKKQYLALTIGAAIIFGSSGCQDNSQIRTDAVQTAETAAQTGLASEVSDMTETTAQTEPASETPGTTETPALPKPQHKRSLLRNAPSIATYTPCRIRNTAVSHTPNSAINITVSKQRATAFA